MADILKYKICTVLLLFAFVSFAQDPTAGPDVVCKITGTNPLTVMKSELRHSALTVENVTEVWQERVSAQIPKERNKIVALENPQIESSNGIAPVMLMVIDESKDQKFQLFEPQDLFNESIYFYNGRIDKIQVSKRLGNGYYVVVSASGGDWYDRWEASVALYLNIQTSAPTWLMAKYEYSQDDAKCMGRKIQYVLDEEGMLRMTTIDVCTERRIGVEEIVLPDLFDNSSLRTFDQAFQSHRFFK